jgi:hypothetical protein
MSSDSTIKKCLTFNPANCHRPSMIAIDSIYVVDFARNVLSNRVAVGLFIIVQLQMTQPELNMQYISIKRKLVELSIEWKPELSMREAHVVAKHQK